ncbi:hypothetical protein ARC272_09115 [Pantoea ananatis]|nr:hypothetical protein ARC272_09115 [Pantoea ananatis]
MQKDFTDANDNDYYCHAFSRVIDTVECTTLLTLLPVLFSQPGAGFFFCYLFPPGLLQPLSTTRHSMFIIFEQRSEVFQLSIFYAEYHTTKNSEEI